MFEQFNKDSFDWFSLKAPEIFLLKDRLERKINIKFKNDHVAFRTLGAGRSTLESFSNFLYAMNYEKIADYDFVEKKLNASAFINKDNEEIPRVFVSEPKLNEFSDKAQNLIKKVAEFYDDKENLVHPLSNQKHFSFYDHRDIINESEYIGWTLIFGMIPNHFTLAVTEPDLFEILLHVQELGYSLNYSNGKFIQRSEKLWQASTKADMCSVYFNDCRFPASKRSCFYEFAQRFDGFDGFVIENANEIFNSTNQ